MSIVSFIFATIKKSDYMSPDSEYTETHENKIYATLDKLGIAYQSLHHPAIMTMEEGAEIAQKLGCTSCKSLFLTNKQQEYFMLLLPANKKLKTKELAGQIGSSHLSFASEKAMENLLCTFPGAVSILGLIYDKENKVQLLIDKEILEGERDRLRDENLEKSKSTRSERDSYFGEESKKEVKEEKKEETEESNVDRIKNMY